MTGDELIGFWSVEHGCHSVMEDEWLMFRADNTGWYAYLRPWFSNILQFRWTHPDGRQVRIETYEEIELDEHDGRNEVQRRYIALVEDVSYGIARVRRPLLDDPVEELQISWSRCLGAPFALVGQEEPQHFEM